jgi:hypothetical protein
MFASRITKDVQCDDGDNAVIVTIQKLSGRSLEKARDARSAAQIASLRTASKDLLQVMRSDQLEVAAEQLAARRAKEMTDAKAKAKARYDSFDREHVLNAGVVRWSCESIKKLSPESIGDLDEESAQKLHEAILDLSLPPLDPVLAEAEEGKG